MSEAKISGQRFIPVDEDGNVLSGGGLSVSGGNWSSAEGDFTAVYLGVDTLTLGSFPSAIGTPVSGQFAAVVMTDATGLQTVYLPGANPMTLSGQVLTVADAAFVAMGGHVFYNVVILAIPKEHDASANGKQNINLNMEHDWLDPRVVVDTTDETDSVIPYYIDVETYKYGTLQIDLGCVAGTVTLTLESSTAVEAEAQGAADYDDEIMLEEFGISSVIAIAGTVKKTLQFDMPISWKYLKVLIDYDTGGNTGDAKVTWRGIY